MADGTGGPNKLDEKGRRVSQTNPDLVFGAKLADQVRMWPTPRAGKVTDEKEETWRKRQRKGDVSTPPLSLAVKMPPRGGRGGAAGGRRGGGRRAGGVADAVEPRRERGVSGGPDTKREDQLGRAGCGGAAYGQSGENWWTVEPQVGRLATGVPNRVAQLRALGNAIVPQVAAEIMEAMFRNWKGIDQ